MSQRVQRPILLELEERYALLRRHSEQLWERGDGIRVSPSEWRMLCRIQKAPSLPLAEVTRQRETTRQAAHKCVRGLAEKGLVGLSSGDGSRRDKRVWLTRRGETCMEEFFRLQQELEAQLAHRLGDEGLDQLRGLLEQEWLPLE